MTYNVCDLQQDLRRLVDAGWRLSGGSDGTEIKVSHPESPKSRKSLLPQLCHVRAQHVPGFRCPRQLSNQSALQLLCCNDQLAEDLLPTLKEHYPSELGFNPNARRGRLRQLILEGLRREPVVA